MIPGVRNRARSPGAALAGAFVALVLVAGSRPASAQPSPLSVNDCTLLPDPSALRRCLDQAEGRVVGPLPPVTGPVAAERSEPPARISDGVPAQAPPARPPSDFLGHRPDRVHESPAPSRNVIDLQ